MGYSRDSFYRFKELYEQGGEMALREISRPPHRGGVVNPTRRTASILPSKRPSCALPSEEPAYGQLRVSNELKKKGILVSPGGVRSVWLRHNLETFQKRLKALEAKVAQEGLILTESQVKALEKAKLEDGASWLPRCAVCTYYVGTIKGVRRIYQHRTLLANPVDAKEPPPQAERLLVTSPSFPVCAGADRVSRPAASPTDPRCHCTRCPKGKHRTLVLHPQAEHEALEAARAFLESEEGRRLYAQRSGVEAVFSQGIRSNGMRRSRYRGLRKTHLQQVATAAAIDLVRLNQWLMGRRPQGTRRSAFERLAA